MPLPKMGVINEISSILIRSLLLCVSMDSEGFSLVGWRGLCAALEIANNRDALGGRWPERKGRNYRQPLRPTKYADCLMSCRVCYRLIFRSAKNRRPKRSRIGCFHEVLATNTPCPGAYRDPGRRPRGNDPPLSADTGLALREGA